MVLSPIGPPNDLQCFSLRGTLNLGGKTSIRRLSSVGEGKVEGGVVISC